MLGPSASGWSRCWTRSPARRSWSWPPAPARPASTAAARIGDDGRLISTDFASEMVEAARRRAEELGLAQRRVPRDGRGADGPRRRLGRRRAVPLGLHADGRSRRGLRARPAACCATAAGSASRSGQSPPATRGRRWRGGALVEHGHLPPPEPGAPGIFAMGDPSGSRRSWYGRRLRRAAHRGGRGRVALRRLRRVLGLPAGVRRRGRRMVIERLDEPQRAEVRARSRTQREAFRGERRLRVPGRRAHRGGGLAGGRGAAGSLGTESARTAPTAAAFPPAGRGPSARRPPAAARSSPAGPSRLSCSIVSG